MVQGITPDVQKLRVSRESFLHILVQSQFFISDLLLSQDNRALATSYQLWKFFLWTSNLNKKVGANALQSRLQILQ